MTQERDVYVHFVKQAIKHPGVSYAFANAAIQHRNMEKEFNQRLLQVCPSPQSLAFPHMEMAASQVLATKLFQYPFPYDFRRDWH